MWMQYKNVKYDGDWNTDAASTMQCQGHSFDDENIKFEFLHEDYSGIIVHVKLCAGLFHWEAKVQ